MAEVFVITGWMWAVVLFGPVWAGLLLWTYASGSIGTLASVYSGTAVAWTAGIAIAYRRR